MHELCHAFHSESNSNSTMDAQCYARIQSLIFMIILTRSIYMYSGILYNDMSWSSKNCNTPVLMNCNCYHESMILSHQS